MEGATRFSCPPGGVFLAPTQTWSSLIVGCLLVVLASGVAPACGQGRTVVTPPLPAAEEIARQDWYDYPIASGCLGGDLCRYNGEERRVRLKPRPVREVRFYAHDAVGPQSRGRLRVRLDGELLARELEIPRRGAVLRLDAVGLRGRELIFEVVGSEEVVLEDVEVLYGPAGSAPWSPPTFESFLYP